MAPMAIEQDGPNGPNGHASNGAIGSSHTNRHSNGHHGSTNGHSNGHSVGYSNGHHANGSSMTSDDSDAQDGPSSTYEPVAIIGCAMRLPGGVSDSEALWDMLINKREGRVLVPESRYNIEAFYAEGKTKPGQVVTKYGHFLDHIDIAEFDPSFWSMHGKEMEELDPSQRLALEVTYECLQNSGTTKFKGKTIGAFFGVFGEDWPDMRAKETQHAGLYRITGYGDFAIANRVSYEFGFTGPSVVIRTACSSSLTALHDACMALHSGDCESAIVGGVNMILNPNMTAGMSELGVLSPEGRCKSFDARADGYARAEGAVVLHVKKLADAIRDNDPIRAVIRGSCINSDGRTIGLSQPNAESHAALIRRSHALAGFDVSQTAMIECHGTGTSVGDPLEAGAVADVFGHVGAFIGSVKPNLGHSEGASGVTSVLKAMLAVEKGVIPPNRNFEVPHPKIPFKEANLVVPVEPMPWPKDRAERIGVNSFGIGGANAHVLLESARATGVKKHTRRRRSPAVANEARLLTFSATTPEALRQVVQSHELYLKSHPEALDDLSYTLNARREPLPQRAYAIVTPETVLEPWQVSPFEKGTGQAPVAFVFTGQGAQWPRMGARLLESNVRFRQTIQRLESELSQCDPPPTWSLQIELLRPSGESRVHVAEFSQPLCTAVQIGLVDLLGHWGIKPQAVVGHSSGEIAAAYASGAITAGDAIRAAYYRGQATMHVEKSKGGMAAVGLGRDAVTPFLVPGVLIGCENSPDSVTLSGDIDKLTSVMDSIQAAHPTVLVRELRVDCAYHSHHMSAVAADYEDSIADIKASAPQVPFFSSVTAAQIVGGKVPLGPSYWVRNLTSPVLFAPAVSALLKHAPLPPLFLEIGPHSALAGPLRQILRAEGASGARYSATLVRAQDDRSAILTSVGNLFQNNIPVDFASLCPAGSVLTDLPLYPWQRSGPYWSESRMCRSWRQRQFPQHDALGARVFENPGSNTTWRNLMRLDDIPWVREHDVSGDIVFPGAGYIAMAGEAARQVSGLSDYTCREVKIINALVLHEGKESEVMTVLKPARLTTTLHSVWHDFEISSFQNESWVVHAFGQVRGGQEYEEKPPNVQDLPRNVPSAKWYNVMKRFGLNYGPRFQGLEDISADPVEKRAVARVKNVIGPNESPYALHPCTIDVAFQALGVAAFQGQSRLFNQLAVPSFIRELYIKPASEDFRIQFDAGITPRGSLYGSAVGVSSSGDTVFRLKDLRLSTLDDHATDRGDNPHAAVELVWRPDINLVDNASLIQLHENFGELSVINERMALACMVESSILLENLTPSKEFLNKYRSWLQKVRQQALEGTYPNVPNCKEIASMSSADRVRLIEEAVQDLQQTKAWPVATAVYRIYLASQAIFIGKVDAVETLVEDDILSRVYDFGRVSDFTDFFTLAAHSKPNLRILEVGAGTGGTTSSILPILRSEYDERLYFSYTYTDISSGFFVGAKERFKEFDAIDYRVLDISKDPLAQGFEANSFDVVVASNVIHATANLAETLGNVRKLLAPKGRLFMQELFPPTKWINYVMGTLPGWWLGEGEGRVEEPYLAPENWDKYLVEAGFDGVDAVFHDGQFNSHIISVNRPLQTRPKEITLLYLQSPSERTEAIEAVLQSAGYDVELCEFNSTPPAGRDIVAVLDVDQPFLHDVTESQWARFKALMEEIEDSGVLWVSGASQINCKDPRYGMMLGLARVVRTEYEIDFATLELDRFDGAGWDAISAVLGEFQTRSDDGEFKPQLEWALADGVVHVGRFHWMSVNNDLAASAPLATARKLDISKRGFLGTLHWQHFEPPKLAPGWIKIQNKAVGLNFKDLLISMGIVEGHVVEGDGLGCECSGVVLEVGPDVTTVSPGDRVMVIASGSFASTLVAHESICVKIPDSLSFVDAATMPLVYCTTIRGMIDQARLEKGQSILIHSAAGGVGIAALHIAKSIGAEIFCTVSNEEKVNFVMREFGIPRNRIFNSRDLTFRRDVLAATNGRGVDVVLNSLSGELLHASWDCVATFGCLVEIGKRDLVGKGALALAPFEHNRSYIGVDFAQIAYDRPWMSTRLLRMMVDMLQRGELKPIAPVTLFDGTQVQDAMRFMQKGDHIGKVVVTMPERAEELDVQTLSRKPALTLDAEASYIFVGGLGGLGQAIAVWLAESGATEIVFLSRSAGDPGKYDKFVQELNALGCSAIMISGSVSLVGDVERAVKATKRPIRGVLQASMVLRDRNMPTMAFDDWQAATDPKVKGTWNLHEVLLKEQQTLDFFVVFSSWSGLVGQPGQANYASGNTFLDSFVQYRHSQGLSAAVVDIGVVDDVGYVSQNSRLLDFFRMTSTHILYEQDILDSLQLLMARSSDKAPKYGGDKEQTRAGQRTFVNKAQLALGLRSTQPLSAPNNRTTWKRDLRMALYRNIESQKTAAAKSENEKLREFLEAIAARPAVLDSEESGVFLAEEIGRTLLGFMLKSHDNLDIHQAPSSIGVDSLVAIELRNWFRQTLGFEITVLEILGSDSLLSLGKLSAKMLKVKYATDANGEDYAKAYIETKMP
ncbi:hypothetical protein OQA88_1478 [Cercophora sp. LCS_1]